MVYKQQREQPWYIARFPIKPKNMTFLLGAVTSYLNHNIRTRKTIDKIFFALSKGKAITVYSSTEKLYVSKYISFQTPIILK